MTRALAAFVIAAALAPPALADPAPHAATATILYFNRCRGGCKITKSGLNDARTHSSQIPEGPGTEFTLTEYAFGDTEWNAFMTCIREVYSPYGVTVTDVQPDGVAYNENIVAGTDRELGIRAGGIAPITSDCSPYSFVLSFTFANLYGTNNTHTVCAVAAQESGHSFGLDHSFEFLDGQSACRDPMSYRGDCGGQRFFRNEQARCGEYTDRPCRCGAYQNAHIKLLSVLGAGTPLTAAPAAKVTQPIAGASVANGAAVLVTASAQRGVKSLELFVNGTRWAETGGAGFGANGQPETTYPLVLPPDLPDGVLDLDVVVKDDIEATTKVPTVRVTKGAPCTSATACAAGQRCDIDGRCLWDPAVGEFGDACTFDQFCKTGLCDTANGQELCTQVCVAGPNDSCPVGFACTTGGSQGVCAPEVTKAGCCSTSGDGAAQAGLGVLALGLVLRRRRRF